MKLTLIIIFFYSSTFLLSQRSINFEIEELTKPEYLLKQTPIDSIYKFLILNDAKLSHNNINNLKIDFDYGIIAQSETVDSLVYYGYNSFFNGMYSAYAEHRPFVLSPDMIWLLISQGFSRHVNANSDE